MKTLRILVLGLLAMVMLVRAEAQCEPGRYQNNNPITALTPDNSHYVQNGTFPGDSTGYAEAITPDIQALANGLQNDPVKIFNYVHDHIRFVLYYGSMKGAELTLLEQSGNDFDQCALLVALLQAAGYSPGYGFGMLEMPYQATDGSQNDLQHWLQLSLANTNWSNTIGYFGQLLGNRGYYVLFDMGDNNHVSFQRVWVTLSIGGTNYLLDPAFKVSQPVTNLVNLATAMGFSSSNVMSVAGGTDTTNYVTNVNEANIRGTLTGYTTNLLNYLQTNCPNASVQSVLGGWQIVPFGSTKLSQSLLFPTFTDDGNYPLQTWTTQPTNFMSTFSVTFAGTNQTWYFPQLQGQGLSLTFDGSGLAKLWLGSSNVLHGTNTGSGLSTTVTLGVTHPFGGWNMSSNTPVDSGGADQSMSRSYQRTNANYALMYGFAPSLKWLNAQEQQLDQYLAADYSNTSPQVVNATLNVMGMEWLAQTELSQELLCQQDNQLPEFHHRVGRMAQEAGHGYYVDVYMQEDETFPATGSGTADLQNEYNVFDVSSYIASALEHGVIEQMQNSNLVAASTVKMLEIANTNKQAVFLATSNNWTTIQGSLKGYSTSNLTSFASLTSQGYYLLLPQSGTNPVAGPGTWKGNGYVELQATPTQRVMGMIIGGGYNGGYVSDPTAVVNSFFTQTTVVNTPSFFMDTPVYTPAPTTADPVDTADGTFQVENTDLSLGQSEPRGITLSRYYNGTRRNSNPAGMANGWIHNYCITANTVGAPEAAFGETTPAQMASMLVTTCAALNLYNNTQPDPKNWLVTALIAKWGVDQVIKNGVSVNLGKNTLQFVKQPNGAFTPPAGSTATLTQTNSAYSLLMRHGNEFNFDTNGLLKTIVDPYGQTMSLTYNASNWISTIKDWTNRQFSFSYSGTPSRLASVSDGTRTVSYGYGTTNNPQGDLVSFTDAEGKTCHYTYDTNHQITATLDALGQLVVSNNYDPQGHITTQLTQGQTNRTWQIFWTGWQTTEIDPGGGQQIYYYDDLSRLIAQQDALGNTNQIFYDGQNQIVATISPMDEISQSVYDGNHNIIQTIDPLNNTNQFFYDGLNNLVEAVDPLGNPTTFGYNAQFSLIGQTNGAGDWVNYTYNANGTMASRSDVGGTTQYGYDSLGQLKTTAYPNSLGVFTNFNSYLGDVTNQINGRGFAVGFQYNNRRQLTNTIAPTNVIVKVGFDAVGNVASITDARGNVTTNSWSPTSHLLTATLPITPQGIPIVTNGYDSRDWLTRAVDALGNPTLYTNDLDGRLISTTDPLQRTTRFTYDNDGRKLMTANAGNETNSQTWDARGSLIQLTDAAGHVSSRLYDAAGNQIVLTNRNGQPWKFHFDTADRLTNTVTPLGRNTIVAFNHLGLVSGIIDPSNQPTSLYYDDKHRLTNRTDNVASTSYSYDANDNPISVIENGQTNAYTYDAYDHVSSFRDVHGDLIQYRYDANGNLTNLIYPGGKNVYYAYDALNRMTNVTDWSGRKSSIAYDLDNRITGITRPNGSYRTLAYDAAGQTTNIMEQMSNGLPIAIFKYNWTNTGNMAWEFAAPLPHTNAAPTRMMTYDADNRLSTFQGPTMGSAQSAGVDAVGDTINAPLTNDTFVSYAYDARYRLLNVGGVTNAYDAANNRIGQTFGTNSVAYVVNPNASLPQVLMRIKNSVTNYYIYGAGLLYQITETASGTNTLAYHYDYRGSTIALSGDNGLVTDRLEYSLYGTTTFRVGTSDTPFLFNGRFGVMTDPNGLLYMRARYYNPYLCRFISADPSGFGGGLNFYTYANGSPVSYFDPTGLGAVGDNNNTSWLNNNNNVASGANNSSAVSNPFNVPSGGEPSTSTWISSSTISQGEVCIECHGVSAGGFNGNVNSFVGITAIPGSGPDAMLGYSILETGSALLGPLVASQAAGPLGDAFDAAVFTDVGLGTTVSTGTGVLIGNADLTYGPALAVVTPDGEVVTTQNLLLSHQAFAQQVLGTTGTQLPAGAWVGTVGNINGQVVGLNSFTFFGNQAPASAAIQTILRAAAH